MSSDWRRAVESIEPFAERSGLVIEPEARLRERVLAADPLPDWRAALERSYRDLDHRWSGGESSREARTRGLGVIEAFGGDGCRRPLVVTHGNLLSLILGAVDPSLGFAFWHELTNPDVYVLDWPARGPDSIRRGWPPPGGAAGKSE